MGTLIDGKAIAKKIDQETAARVDGLKKRGVIPRLEVILAGDNKASLMYDRMKGAAAEKLGIAFALHHVSGSLSPDDLIAKISSIQENPDLSGLILQLPLPEHLYIPRVLNAIRPEVDVDFLTNERIGSLVMNTSQLLPPTPGAVARILEELGVQFSGANVTIVGMGNLVGKPLAIMMINRGASVTTVNSRTKNMKEKCLSADIIVTGVGKRDILRGDMVRPGAVVIDTGISFDADGKVFGDVTVSEVINVAAHVTPTPGGVGPVTVAMLLVNTVRSTEALAGRRV